MMVQLEYVLCYGLLLQWYQVLFLWIVKMSRVWKREGENVVYSGVLYMHLHS